MKTKEVLEKITAYEQAELDRLSGPKPADPPELIEEPSELIDTPTAYGGWWRRRRFADGSESRPYFRQTPPPRFANQAAVDAARRLQNEWLDKRRSLWPHVRLLSGAARNWFDGNKTGRRGGSLPDETIEEVAAHYGQRISVGGYLSHTGRYAAELLEALNKINL